MGRMGAEDPSRAFPAAPLSSQADAGSVPAPLPVPTPQGKSPRILIVFSDTGGGHRAAARALSDALKQLDPTCSVTVVDPLITQGPAVIRNLASLYSPVIRRSRAAWGAVYHTSNTKPTFAAIRAVFGRPVRKVLIDAMKNHDPDVVLSVHPLLNHVGYQAIQRSGRPRALMTVITDLVDFHRGWTFSKADLVIAPTELARKVALRRRVPADRIKLLGLPVDLRFRPPAPGEKRALRRRFGLDERRFTVLAMGGAAGAGQLLKQVRVLAWESHPWQVVAVCGRNERLRRRLARVRFATPTLVLGFVDFMPELMRACDVTVTKAGPGAIAEALATGVPVIITSFLPGQESPNVDFVVESGFGTFSPKADDLLEEVRVLAEGGPTWQEMSRRAAELAHPYASSDIARECLLLADRYRASAQARR
jgi:1,2-diacylglycerol 3-beta-galactosyltransferase